jgi:hypothetical protein
MAQNMKFSTRVRARLRVYFEEGYENAVIGEVLGISERQLRRFRHNLKLYGELDRPVRCGRPKKLKPWMEDVRVYLNPLVVTY